MSVSVLNRKGGSDYSDLFAQDRSAPHWAHDYASRLADRHPAEHRILIQTSMSPSGTFHIGNLRDTICAHLIHRALCRLGRRSAILLSFDDYDPVRDSQAASHAELAPYAGRPQAVARARSTAICRAYIAELKALGICPPEADPDGRTPPGSAWETHYQWERYTAGSYAEIQRRYVRGAGRLADILGVSDKAGLFRVYCEQCGRNTTDIIDLHERKVRYHCRTCGARISTGQLGSVKPSWALDWTLRVAYEDIDCEPAGQDHCSAGSTMDRTRGIYRHFLRRDQPVIVPYGLVRQIGHKKKVSGSSAGGLAPTDLLRVFPTAMIHWLYARPNCVSDMRIGLDKAFFLWAHAEFDRLPERARHHRRDAALYELIGDGVQAAGSRPLPSMRRVLGTLHAYCYDTDLVTAELTADGGERTAIAERVRHALAWVSTHGRETSWLYGPPAVEDGAGLDGPLRYGTLAGRWDRERHRALHAALFGVQSGPPLRRLIEVFSEPVIVQAVWDYLLGGDRPLLDQVVARLDEAKASGLGAR